MKKWIVGISIALCLNTIPIYDSSRNPLDKIQDDYDMVVHEVDMEGSPNFSHHSFQSWPGFSIMNFKSNGENIDLITIIQEDVIPAGVNTEIGINYSSHTKVKGVYSLSDKEVNSKLGLSHTKNINLDQKQSVSCPYFFNHKKVKECYIVIYPKKTTYIFEEEFLGNKSGEGTVNVLSGFYEIVSYRYE